jgi:uncharacterized protein (TIGR03437 family)
MALNLFAIAATAQPVVSGALNAAGYMRPGLPNGGVARGSFVAIFGSNIGPAVPPSGIAVSGYPLQTTFGGVSARLGGRDLFIVYGSPGQVGAVIPSDAPLGTQQLTVTFGGATSAALNVQVVARSFGVFTLNQAGSGPVVGLKFISNTNQPPSTLFESMNPGGTITLFGTGLGPSNNPDNLQATNLAIPGLNASDIQVTVGGRPAPVTFFGRSSCCSAIDQINIQIPPDAPTGCYVPLIVRVSGITANVSTLSIAPSGRSICSDPNGFTEAQLSAIQSRGSLRQGSLSMVKVATEGDFLGEMMSLTSDAALASFEQYTADQLVRSSGSAGFFTLTNGSCTVFSFEGDDATFEDPIEPTELDAGPTIQLQNSLGSNVLEKIQGFRGTYSKSVIVPPPGLPPGIPGFGPEFLTTGNHTFTGPGGADVGAFSASLNWPAAFNWTNRAAVISVNRSANLPVTWSGGDPQGQVQIFGWSGAIVNNNEVGAGFVCLESAAAGSFTVPSAILSALPASGIDDGVNLGYLSVYGQSRLGNFTAPGIDLGWMLYLAGQAKGNLRYN